MKRLFQIFADEYVRDLFYVALLTFGILTIKMLWGLPEV